LNEIQLRLIYVKTSKIKSKTTAIVLVLLLRKHRDFLTEKSVGMFAHF